MTEGKDDPERRHYFVYTTEDYYKNDIFWKKCGVLFEIACLLHDCGHAPFSHTLEFIYTSTKRSNESLNKKLLQYVTSGQFKSDFEKPEGGVFGNEHERMGALIVCSEYKESVKILLEKRGFDKISIMDENQSKSSDTIDDDIEFIVRMIIGCKYKVNTKKDRIKNCIISLLNSDSFDVDTLDYIIRDSKLSGVDNMSVDVDRLLNSLTLVEKTVFNKKIVNTAKIKTNILSGSLETNETTKVNINAQCHGSMLIKGFTGTLAGSISCAGYGKIKQKCDFVPSIKNILHLGAQDYSENHELPCGGSHESSTKIFAVAKSFVDIQGDFSFGKEHDGKISGDAEKQDIW